MSAYFQREVEMAISNLEAGHEARHTLHSKEVLLEAEQIARSADLSWGCKFRKDPRRFSSTPRMASAEQVATYLERAAR